MRTTLRASASQRISVGVWKPLSARTQRSPSSSKKATVSLPSWGAAGASIQRSMTCCRLAVTTAGVDAGRYRRTVQHPYSVLRVDEQPRHLPPHHFYHSAQLPPPVEAARFYQVRKEVAVVLAQKPQPYLFPSREEGLNRQRHHDYLAVTKTLGVK